MKIFLMKLEGFGLELGNSSQTWGILVKTDNFLAENEIFLVVFRSKTQKIKVPIFPL